MTKFKTVFLLHLFISINLFGQSSFRDYKEEKSGIRMTYSDGLKKNEEHISFPIFGKTVSKSYEKKLDIYPSFKAGIYSLIISEYKMPSGKYYKGSNDIYGFCEAGEEIFLIINIDNGKKILQLQTKYVPIGNTIDGIREYFKDLKFKIDKEIILSLASAQNIQIKISTTKLNRFEDFDYSFEYNELIGLRDFIEGMKLTSIK
jgi:hypothetical protein